MISLSIPGKCHFVFYDPHGSTYLTYVGVELRCPNLNDNLQIPIRLEDHHSPIQIHKAILKANCQCKKKHRILAEIDHSTGVFWKGTKNKKFLEILVQPFCNICARPLSGGYPYCWYCQFKKVAFHFNELRALSIYRPWRDTDPIREEIKILKNENSDLSLDQVREKLQDLEKFFIWGLNKLYPHFREADFIIPLPAHPNTIRTRGYNQTELLAEFLTKDLEKPVLNNLVRKIKDIPSQRGLDRPEREKNVKGCFQLNTTILDNEGKPKSRYLEIYKGKVFLLVDDVVTTGFTTDECCKSLRKLNPKKIYVYAVARDVTVEIDSKHRKVRHLKGALSQF